MIGNIHLKQSAKGIRTKTLLLCIGLFVFEFLFAILASSSYIRADLAKNMKETPPMVSQMMGEGFADAVMKYSIMAFGYVHPFMLVLFILFIFFAFSQVITSEISSGAIGFTLSKPVSRNRIFFNLWIIIYIGLGLLSFSTFLSSFLGIVIFQGGQLSSAPFGNIAWNLFLVMIVVAGYVSILAATSDSGKILFTRGGVILVVLYLISMADPLWKPLEFISPISPFKYYIPMNLFLGGHVPTLTAVLMIGVSILMFGFAAFLFNKKDIAVG